MEEERPVLTEEDSIWMDGGRSGVSPFCRRQTQRPVVFARSVYRMAATDAKKIRLVFESRYFGSVRRWVSSSCWVSSTLSLMSHNVVCSMAITRNPGWAEIFDKFGNWKFSSRGGENPCYSSSNVNALFWSSVIMRILPYSANVARCRRKSHMQNIYLCPL